MKNLTSTDMVNALRWLSAGKRANLREKIYVTEEEIKTWFSEIESQPGMAEIKIITIMERLSPADRKALYSYLRVNRYRENMATENKPVNINISRKTYRAIKRLKNNLRIKDNDAVLQYLLIRSQ